MIDNQDSLDFESIKIQMSVPMSMYELFDTFEVHRMYIDEGESYIIQKIRYFVVFQHRIF